MSKAQIFFEYSSNSSKSYAVSMESLVISFEFRVSFRGRKDDEDKAQYRQRNLQLS